MLHGPAAAVMWFLQIPVKGMIEQTLCDMPWMPWVCEGGLQGCLSGMRLN